MSALPSYRQFLLLAALPDWKSTVDGLTETEQGGYLLDPLPGDAMPLEGAPALKAPVALAATKDAVYVLDRATMRIVRFSPGSQRPAHMLPGIGGRGGDPRHFRSASSIAVLARGEIAVADPGDGSVKLFSAYPHALFGVWRGLGRPTALAAGARGTLWVLDEAGKRVIAVDDEGHATATLPGIAFPKLQATNAAGEVAVLDGDTLRLFTASREAGGTVGQVASGSSIAFLGNDALYAGAAGGLVHAFLRDRSGAWRNAGIGVLGIDAAIPALLAYQDDGLIALVRPEGADLAQLWSIRTDAAHRRLGSLTTQELDSGTTNCVWHRIALDADLPPGTSIRVQTETTAAPAGPSPAGLISKPIVLTGEARDCLVQSPPGRYLRLTLTVQGDGVATPVLRAIRIWFPRDSWLQYLPSVYQEDAVSRSFIERFLSILQTEFDALDERVDDLWTLFDPSSVPEAAFAWLAAWLALPIEPGWTDAQRRSVLKQAFVQYGKRGTAAGLEQVIQDYAGIQARLVEHFRLRRLILLAGDRASATPVGGRLWSSDIYRRLQVGRYARVDSVRIQGAPEPGMEPLAWGAHQFSVYFDAEPGTVAATQKKLAAVIEREKPAHTMATYRPVYPRLRVGVQALLGIDTRVGTPGQAVLGQISTLGYDAVIAPSRLTRSMRAIGAVPRARLGVTSRLMPTASMLTRGRVNGPPVSY